MFQAELMRKVLMKDPGCSLTVVFKSPHKWRTQHGYIQTGNELDSSRVPLPITCTVSKHNIGGDWRC